MVGVAILPAGLVPATLAVSLHLVGGPLPAIFRVVFPFIALFATVLFPASTC
jgi:hypothetical protein